MQRWNLVLKLKDETIIYRNPFADTESWTIPARKHRPFHTNRLSAPEKLQAHSPENYCAFCPANYPEATPEKTRIERREGKWILLDEPNPGHIFSKSAEFRRIGNLYEILSTNYWTKNHGYQLSVANINRKNKYLADPRGREHIESLLDRYAMRPEIRDPVEAANEVSNNFFGGAHDLIIPRRHYVDQATHSNQLCSTGSLTPDEHHQYLRLTCYAVNDIYANNPFVAFVGVYTNWRHAAGASFEHLHRQVIGVDRYGHTLKNGLRMAGENAKIYQDYVNHVALSHGLFLCENEHALAFVDIGHSFATVAIYSKAASSTPCEQSSAELKDMSDLIHAVHAAFGADEAVNEEWYYQPRDSAVKIPWHVLIKWRNHRHAGIENIIDIYPDDYGPVELKRILLDKLFKLSADNRIGTVSFDPPNEIFLSYFL